MEVRKKSVVRLLIVVVVLLLVTGCRQEPGASSNESPKPKQATSSAQFDQPDVPFTFSYPPVFFTGASIGIPLRQGKNGPEAAPPTYQLQIDDHDGIHIRQAAAAELSSDKIIAGAEKAVLVAGGRLSRDVQKESCGGREVVVVEAEFEFPTQPPIPGRQKGYTFGAGGKTWEVDFFSSTPSGMEAASGASSLFCQSVSFR